MGRSHCTFRQSDATRAARAAIAAGLEVSRIEINRDGKIVVVTADRRDEAEEPSNDWADAK